MERLRGKTSDRIRSGEIPEEMLTYKRPEEVPDPDKVRHGKGFGLGKGATRARGGDESKGGRK